MATTAFRQAGLKAGRRAHRGAGGWPCCSLLLRLRRAASLARQARGPRLQDGRRCAAHAHRHAISTASRIRNGSCCARPHRLVIDLPETRLRPRPEGAQAARPGRGRSLRRSRRGRRRADPDRQGAVHRRALRRAAQREGAGLPAGRRPVGGLRQGVRRGAVDPGRDDRLDAADAQGRPRSASRRPTTASPSSSIPAMAASTAAPRAPSGTVEKDVTLAFATRTARPARARTAATRSS